MTRKEATDLLDRFEQAYQKAYKNPYPALAGAYWALMAGMLSYDHSIMKEAEYVKIMEDKINLLNATEVKE